MKIGTTVNGRKIVDSENIAGCRNDSKANSKKIAGCLKDWQYILDPR